MTTKEIPFRTRALTVAATAALALGGLLPAAAAASPQDGADHGRAQAPRGYVCDRLERHHDGAVGSGRCLAFRAPRHGDIRGAFTIESRWMHHRVLCEGRHGHPSGYANTPRWVRGEHCRRI